MKNRKEEYTEKLSEFIGEIDDDILAEAQSAVDSLSLKETGKTAKAEKHSKRRVRTHSYLSLRIMAACLCVLIIGGAALLIPDSVRMSVFGVSATTTQIIVIAPPMNFVDVPGFSLIENYIDKGSIKTYSDVEGVYFSLEEVYNNRGIVFKLVLHNSSEQDISMLDESICLPGEKGSLEYCQSGSNVWNSISMKSSGTGTVTVHTVLMFNVLNPDGKCSKTFNLGNYEITEPGKYRYSVSFGKGIANPSMDHKVYIEFTLTDVPPEEITTLYEDTSIPKVTTEADGKIPTDKAVSEVGYMMYNFKNSEKLSKYLLLDNGDILLYKITSMDALDAIYYEMAAIDTAWIGLTYQSEDYLSIYQLSETVNADFFNDNFIYAVYLTTPDLGGKYSFESIINSNKTFDLCIYCHEHGDTEAHSGWLFMQIMPKSSLYADYEPRVFCADAKK